MSHPIYRALVTYSNTATGEIRIKIPSLLGVDSEVFISYIGRAIKGTTWSVPDIGAQIVVTADDANLTNIFWLQVDEAQSSGGYGDALVGSTNTFTTNQIIAGTTTAALLRITQLGTGNALLVEDSTNPDSTPVVIDGSGYVGIGTTTPFQPAGYGALTVDGSSGSIYSGRVASTETFRIQSTAASTTINGIASVPLIFNTANTERIRIDSAGQVGIGSATATGYNILAGKNITGALSSYGMVIQGSIMSDVTGNASTFTSAINTTAAVFTLSNLNHFQVVGVTTPGTGSTITNQFGFRVNASTTGATNNYGFFGAIPSGTGRWNLYMGGNADNYMAGRLGVGTVLTTGSMAAITNATAADDVLILKGAAIQTGDFLDIQNSAGTSQFRIDSSGQVGIASSPTANVRLTVTGGSTNSANPAILINGVSGSGSLFLFNDMGAGAYNNIVSAGSKGVIATGANSTTTRASFVIAPWSDLTYGIRFEGGATTNILQHGTVILSPSAAANKALIVKGVASQTANLQEWQDSASAVKAFVSPTGAAQFLSIDGGTP